MDLLSSTCKLHSGGVSPRLIRKKDIPVTDRLLGKTIAITGAGRGIGRALALSFAQEGARIIVSDLGADGEGGGAGSKAPADEVVCDIKDNGGEAVAVYDDIATIAGGENVVRAAVESFGSLDGLVNCAGIMAPDKPLWEVDEDEWDMVLRVNLRGHFCPIRAAIPVMRKQGSGRIVYVSSSSSIAADHGNVGNDHASPYGASKAGVLGLMWATATELYQYGITSNAILPGAASRLVDIRLPDTKEAAAFHSDKASGTWRDPAHIAPITAYLLSDAGATINGQSFGIMGGRLAHYRNVQPEKVINAEEGIGFSMDELFRRLPKEFGADINYVPATFPPPVTK